MSIRAEQVGRRLGESINEMAHLLYNENTKKNFFGGLVVVLNKASVCFNYYRKTSCENYGVVLGCDQHRDEKKTI